MSNTRGKETAVLLVMQVVCIVLFGLFVDYDATVSPGSGNATQHELEEIAKANRLYPLFQDVHVMMLMGFGFLMTFLKRHGFGSVGFNFLLTAYVIEWSTLVNGWFGMIGQANKIYLTTESLLHADFAVATVLISFGAVLGVASPLQLTIMATLEVVVYNINIYLGDTLLGAHDVGGSIFIHAFGAYFGLAVARVLYKKKQVDHPREGSEYHSDLFAMIGTLFLWLYWPSFNAGPVEGGDRHRAIINTVLSLAACTVTTFAVSSVTDKKGKLDMVHIQNATLAGGVAMGASADLMVHPFGALLIGTAAGILSTIGYKYIQGILQNRLKLHDTCGVHNLHGMPGILGAVASAITWAIVNTPASNGRSGGTQGGFQIAALAIALGLSIVGGALTGFLLKLKVWDNLGPDEMYEDNVFWECPDENEGSSVDGENHQTTPA